MYVRQCPFCVLCKYVDSDDGMSSFEIYNVTPLSCYLIRSLSRGNTEDLAELICRPP